MLFDMGHKWKSSIFSKTYSTASDWNGWWDDKIELYMNCNAVLQKHVRYTVVAEQFPMTYCKAIHMNSDNKNFSYCFYLCSVYSKHHNLSSSSLNSCAGFILIGCQSVHHCSERGKKWGPLKCCWHVSDWPKYIKFSV